LKLQRKNLEFSTRAEKLARKHELWTPRCGNQIKAAEILGLNCNTLRKKNRDLNLRGVASFVDWAVGSTLNRVPAPGGRLLRGHRGCRAPADRQR
jgi:hypothetical protein